MEKAKLSAAPLHSFCGLVHISEANIPAKIDGRPVTRIGYRAFDHRAKSLLKVTIPSSVAEISTYAFRGSYAKEVVLSDGVKKIGDGAFAFSNLTSIVMPDSVKSIGKSAFTGCKSLKSVKLPEKLQILEADTFSVCTSLKEIVLPESLRIIGKSAFAGCSSLEDIALPENLVTIGESAFAGCSSLTSLTIGPNVKRIDVCAFSGCNSLKGIYFQSDAPLAYNVFAPDIFHTQEINGIDGLTIYYPEGASGWPSTWYGCITKPYQFDPSKPVTPPPSDPVTAAPTSSKIYVNGTAMAFDAYNIKDNNYFKLRDLAFVLSGSLAQFEVSWDGAANAIRLTSGRPYTPVGGEMSSKGAINKVGKPTNSALYLDGKQVSFTAYNIDNNNYFKLRDIGQALNFSVEWNGATNSIEINTNLPYRPE